MTSPEIATPEDQRRQRLPALAWIAIVVVLCLGGGLIAYAISTGLAQRVHAQAALKEVTLDQSVPTVTVIHPQRGAPAEEVVLPGNAQAYVATPIYARTNGYLKAWYFDIGAHVKAGQLLAEIETPEVDRQLDQARADLATAQANLQLSQSTADRYEALLKSDSVAKQDVEDRVGDLHAKKAMVDSATYNVRRLEETQHFQKVYAPFDGVITARNIDIGALINAGGNAPGKELFDIAATKKLRVYVNVPQQYSRDVRPGARADLTQAEFPGRKFNGTIVRSSDSIDPSSRTLLTEVDVDNPTGELLPGAFLSVHLKLTTKSGTVMVPVNALIFRSQGMQVALVRDNKAELVSITIGRDYGNQVEVVSGATAADQIIENPSDSLTSGTEVRLARGTDK
ncbi:MAG TPA: efflux RND transporter periplasmic adaptor subunit [Bryobacteraceae bacterium]|jgi:RND family efflux transporter MFP subunit|nr:efflux RND transporter periplasmic adaptor subunit [Bryobacteraceae bacterium]